MKTITFDAVWNGELSAGIRSGSEVVTISFEHGCMDEDAIEFFRECVAEYFDGAGVKARAPQDDAEEHPQTDSHLAACGPCMMAHDKALPDGQEPDEPTDATRDSGVTP